MEERQAHFLHKMCVILTAKRYSKNCPRLNAWKKTLYQAYDSKRLILSLYWVKTSISVATGFPWSIYKWRFHFMSFKWTGRTIPVWGGWLWPSIDRVVPLVLIYHKMSWNFFILLFMSSGRSLRCIVCWSSVDLFRFLLGAPDKNNLYLIFYWLSPTDSISFYSVPRAEDWRACSAETGTHQRRHASRTRLPGD